MNRRSMLWRVAAVAFTVLNVGGVVWGAVMGDVPHMIGHVALQVAGYAVWRLTAGVRREDVLATPQLDDARIEYLQQSVDAIALEVERIGEKQRFSDKLQMERGKPPEGDR